MHIRFFFFTLAVFMIISYETDTENEYVCVQLSGMIYFFSIQKESDCIGPPPFNFTDPESGSDPALWRDPGDALFVYTDGVPEYADPSGSFWGMGQLEKALNQAPALPPEDLVHRIRRDIATFVSGAEQFDDLTMMCMEYRGENASGAET